PWRSWPFPTPPPATSTSATWCWSARTCTWSGGATACRTGRSAWPRWLLVTRTPRARRLLGWAQVAEGRVDQGVVGDLETAGEEEGKAQRPGAEGGAAEHRREGARGGSGDVGDAGGRRPLVGIDDSHGVGLARRHVHL